MFGPDHLLRIDATGTMHPLGRAASHDLRARSGEWRLLRPARDAMLLREAREGRVVRLCGEISAPGALSDVVALIAQASWTGELVVLDESTCRTLFLEGGLLVGANTDASNERIGAILYRFGIVTKEQIEEVAAAAEQTGKRIGAAAVGLELVTPERLYAMMTRQVEEVFYAAMRAANGVFYLFDRFDEACIPARQALSAGALLMESARRLDEMIYFREKIPNESYVPVALSATRKVPEELRAVFDQCDGKRSIEEVGRQVGLLEFEVTRAVFQLVSAGLVAIIAPRPSGPEAVVSAFNPALLEIHRRCDGAGKSAELRDALARFATGGGIYDALFQGAGPLADGSLRADRIARNLGALAGEDPDAWLTHTLQDYVGFALFQAGTLLSRDDERALSQFVNDALKAVRATDAQAFASRSSWHVSEPSPLADFDPEGLAFLDEQPP